MLTVDTVSLTYTQRGGLLRKSVKVPALRAVSLELRRGETLGVIGYNGAGKSSLLRLIAGIIRPDSGRIERYGNSAALLSFGAGFEPRLTGRQNVMLSGLQLGMTRARIRECTGAILELAGLGESIDRAVHGYSTGMRARLGFAIAYHVHSDIMLIDEALATGDAPFRARASELIRARIDSDQSVIIVSHAMPLISDLCTRVVQIEDGVMLPETDMESTIKRYLRTRRAAEGQAMPTPDRGDAPSGHAGSQNAPRTPNATPD